MDVAAGGLPVPQLVDVRALRMEQVAPERPWVLEDDRDVRVRPLCIWNGGPGDVPVRYLPSTPLIRAKSVDRSRSRPRRIGRSARSRFPVDRDSSRAGGTCADRGTPIPANLLRSTPCAYGDI